MADIENLAMAEPAVARRPMYLLWVEKTRDFFARYSTANHGSGDEDDAVAVAAEPQEHTRWILIFLVTVGAVFLFCAGMYMTLRDEAIPIYMMFIWESVALGPGFVAAFLIAECKKGGPLDDEEQTMIVDYLLQL
jgi:hypothetical protein